MFGIPKMHFYYHRDTKGLIHVQNAVMGYLGQHHVHTEKGFEKWKNGISPDVLHESETQDCDCGLKPREARSHDGHITKTEEV